MRNHRSLLVLLAPLLFSVTNPVSGATNQETVPQAQPSSNPAVPVPTEARRLALEAAGAFTNDGFRIRDAEWSFALAKATPLFLQVTLFAGNRYWFVTATPTLGVKLRLTLFDNSGNPLKSEQWQDSGEHGGSRTAAGIAANASGTYFIGVELLEAASNQPLDCSLVSAYK